MTICICAVRSSGYWICLSTGQEDLEPDLHTDIAIESYYLSIRDIFQDIIQRGGHWCNCHILAVGIYIMHHSCKNTTTVTHQLAFLPLTVYSVSKTAVMVLHIVSESDTLV